MCFIGCVNMLGAAINQSVKEYQKHKKWAKEGNPKTQRYREKLFEDAETYLFSPRGLEAQLKRIGFEIDIEWFRTQIKSGKKINLYNLSS